MKKELCKHKWVTKITKIKHCFGLFTTTEETTFCIHCGGLSPYHYW